ncbi:MAG: hypothetical protein ACE5IZ_11595, partial [Dehalococcoidia bacterium]
LRLARAELVELAKAYVHLRERERLLTGRTATVAAQCESAARRLEEQRLLLDARRSRLHQAEIHGERLQGRLRALEEAAPPELARPRQLQLLPALAEPVPSLALIRRPPLWRRLMGLVARWRGRPGQEAMVPISQALTPAAATTGAMMDVPGVLTGIAEVIQVPAGLERAIAAALADRAEALVVASHADALAAAEAVARQDGPRTILLPLKDIQAVYPPYLLRESGVVGVAANLVRCHERYRPLVNALLGRTIVVEEVGTAQQVLRRGVGSVVTRDGIMLHPSGLVASGRGSTAIAHHRDLRSIPRQLQRLERDRGRLSGEVASLEAAVSQGATELEALRREGAESRSAQEALRGELAQARQAIGRVQGQIRQLLTAQRAAVPPRAVSAPDRARLEEEYQRLAAAALDAETTAQRQRDALAAVVQRRDAIAQEVAEARVKAGAIEGQLPTVHHLRQSHDEALARLNAQLEGKQSQLQALAKEARALEQRLRAREEALDRGARWLAGQETEAAPHRQQLADLER